GGCGLVAVLGRAAPSCRRRADEAERRPGGAARRDRNRSAPGRGARTRAGRSPPADRPVGTPHARVTDGVAQASRRRGLTVRPGFLAALVVLGRGEVGEVSL